MKQTKLLACIAASAMLLTFAACAENGGVKPNSGGGASEPPYVTRDPRDTPEPKGADGTSASQESQAATPELTEYSYEYDESGFEAHTVFFPENTLGRQDSNADIYDIAPFAVRFVLPKGWTYRNHPDKNEFYLGTWDRGDTGTGNSVYSVLFIYNERNECVGAIGYDTCGEVPDADSEYYFETAFGFRGNHEYFDYGEALERIPNQWENNTAVTKMCRDASYLSAYMENPEDMENPAVLSCLGSKGLCVMLELGAEYADDALVRTIAESLEMTAG